MRNRAALHEKQAIVRASEVSSPVLKTAAIWNKRVSLNGISALVPTRITANLAHSF